MRSRAELNVGYKLLDEREVGGRLECFLVAVVEVDNNEVLYDELEERLDDVLVVGDETKEAKSLDS